MISDEDFNRKVLDELEILVDDIKSGFETPNIALLEGIKTLIWNQLPRPLRTE